MTCRAHWIISGLSDEMDDEKYTEWEREFVESIAERIEGLGEAVLTEKQMEVLERIWKK